MITFDLLKNHQQHISELAQLMFEEWEKFYPNSSLEIMSNWLHKTARQNGLPISMLALDEQNLAGCAMIQNHELYREKGIMPWLAGLLVKQEYQQQGIGKQLNQWAIKYAQSLGHKKLFLLAFDQDLSYWYKSLGWKTLKSIDLHNHSTTIMEFRLPERIRKK